MSDFTLRHVKNTAGKLVWMLDGYHNGARHRKVMPGPTKREAKEQANAAWAKITFSGPAESMISLSGALEAHRARPGISPWTVSLERRCAKKLMDILGGNTPVKEITTFAVERFKKIRGEGVAPRTCNMELQILRACLNWLKDMKCISSVPCEVVKLPESRKRFRALTAAQADALLVECDGDLYDCLVCLVTLGLRRGELYRLRWVDVDFESEILLVLTRKKGASGEFIENRMPVGPLALEVLRRRHQERHRRKTDLIFGIEPSMRRRGPGIKDGVEYTHDDKLGTKLRKAAKRAGIPDPDRIRPYDLRHTFATLAIRSGANIRDVAALMRHRSPKLTLEVYAHEGEEEMRQAVRDLGIAGKMAVDRGGDGQ